MKTIDPKADLLYKKWKSVQVAADNIKVELMQYMASLPEGHTSAFCSYVKPSKTFNTTTAAIMAMKEDLTVPTKEKEDWKAFHELLQKRSDWDGLQDRYPLFKTKAGYIRSEKKVA